ncbi:MAG: hypothetical protein FWG02_09735, partial [Holophagaceae bacterium]|nr:hypothetical protein [Holophagaceae bacterium]
MVQKYIFPQACHVGSSFFGLASRWIHKTHPEPTHPPCALKKKPRDREFCIEKRKPAWYNSLDVNI